LSQHPYFNPQRFASLVHKFGGYDSVRFVSSLLYAFWGNSPLPPIYSETCNMQVEVHISFPKLLSIVGGWGALCHSTNELLLPMNHETIVNRLNANTIVAAKNNHDLRQYALFVEENKDEEFSRAIVQSPGSEVLPLRLSVMWTQDGLCFNVSLLRYLPKTYRYWIVLYDFFASRYDSLRWVNLVETGIIEQSPCSNASVSFCEQGYTVHIPLPWQDTFNTSGQATSVFVMLAIMKGRKTTIHFQYFHFPYDVMVLLPLHIICD